MRRGQFGVAHRVVHHHPDGLIEHPGFLAHEGGPDGADPFRHVCPSGPAAMAAARCRCAARAAEDRLREQDLGPVEVVENHLCVVCVTRRRPEQESSRPLTARSSVTRSTVPGASPRPVAIPPIAGRRLVPAAASAATFTAAASMVRRSHELYAEVSFRPLAGSRRMHYRAP